MLRVLLADDDSIIIRGMKKIIAWEELGFTIAGTASNGGELVTLCQTQRPDIVITDIEMPKLNGFDVIDILLVEFPWIKIVILSGHERFDYARKAIERGVFRYLLKPLNSRELVDVLNKLKTRIEEEKKSGNLIAGETFPDSERVASLQSHVFDSKKVVEVVRAEITNKLDQDLTLEAIANRYYINPNYFSKIFKQETGENFVDYKIRMKMEYAKVLLKKSELKIFEISERVGYDDQRYFSRIFKKYTGMTPNEYKENLSDGCIK